MKLTAVLDRVIELKEELVAPLLQEWQDIMVEDNRKGVMDGTDRFGVPMLPVTYRTGHPKPVRARGRKNPLFGTTDLSVAFKGTLPNNNLSTSEYKKLTGPPLAPRGLGSRVITNFKTTRGHDGKNWLAIGFWDDVISVKGVPFLKYLFRRRDLRGLRPPGRKKATEALATWMRWVVGH